MALLGQRASAARVKFLPDPLQLDNELVVRGVQFIALPGHVIRAYFTPQRHATAPRVGEGPRHANCADGVEFVCIKEAHCLDAARLDVIAKTVRLDAVHYRLDEFRRFSSEGDACGAACQHRMICLWINVEGKGSGVVRVQRAADVVQQGRLPHDFDLRAFSPGEALCQRQHAQHMRKIMHRVFVCVKGAGFFDGDQHGAARLVYGQRCGV